MLWQYVLVMIAIVVAIVLQSDADLPLMLMSYKEDSAFAGQVIWIAGASSGIGASLAENMVRAGALVVISARRVGQLEDVANFCAQFGTRPFVVEMDMTSLESQERAFKVVIQKFGHIDSLILNAGQSQRNVAVETSLEVTQQLMNLNFMSYVSLTKLVVPTMISRHQGQVI
jgi:dehydrogenase/reductase SDR family protein 7B